MAPPRSAQTDLAGQLGQPARCWPSRVGALLVPRAAAPLAEVDVDGDQGRRRCHTASARPVATPLRARQGPTPARPRCSSQPSRSAASGCRRPAASRPRRVRAPGARAGRHRDPSRRPGAGTLSPLRGADNPDGEHRALAGAAPARAVRQETLRVGKPDERPRKRRDMGRDHAAMEVAHVGRAAGALDGEVDWPRRRVERHRPDFPGCAVHGDDGGAGGHTSQPMPLSNCAVSNSGRPTTPE